MSGKPIIKQWDKTHGESGRRLDHLLSDMPVVLYSCKPYGDFQTTFISSNVTKLLGYKPEEFYAESTFWGDHLHPDDATRVYVDLNRGLERGSLTLKYRFRHKDGHYLWMRDDFRLTADLDGRPNEIIGSWIDVTSQKQAEEALALSEKRLRDILDSLFGFVGLYTLDGTLIEANRAPLEAAGLAREEVIGKPFWETYWWSYSPEVQARLRDAMGRAARGETVRYEEPVRMRGGVLRTIDVMFGPLRDASGAISNVLGFAVDITDRKRMEESLRENQRALSTLMSNLPGTVYRCRNDSDWTVELASEGCLELTGYRPSDLTEGKVSYGREVIHPDDQAAVWNQVQAAVRENRPFQLNYRIITADRKEKWVWEQGRGIFSANGDLLGLEGFITDITERRRAEQQIRDSLQEKEVLLKEIHHRTKNNLQIVSSLFNLKKDSIPDPNLARIIRESQDRIRAMALVHEKLYQSENLERIDLGDYIVHLVESLRRTYDVDPKKIDLRLSMETGQALHIDKAIPCGLIVNELITNAIKYAFPGMRTGAIGVETAKSEGTIRLTVWDNGVGLPPDLDLENITTLGLSLVLTLSRQIGGSLEINGNQGTRANIRIPIDGAQETEWRRVRCGC